MRRSLTFAGYGHRIIVRLHVTERDVVPALRKGQHISLRADISESDVAIDEEPVAQTEKRTLCGVRNRSDRMGSRIEHDDPIDAPRRRRALRTIAEGFLRFCLILLVSSMAGKGRRELSTTSPREQSLSAFA